MNTKNEEHPAFIRVGDRMFNLRFVKKVELRNGSLVITIPDGAGESDIYLHEGAQAAFAALKPYCVN